jgi:cystathionine beta-lyase/cystathionine gamma-synthase
MGMGESLVRLSIGIEDSNDLINDIISSLDSI